jgi:hypothetical protein
MCGIMKNSSYCLNKEILCFAHLTNTMPRQEEAFEKGEPFSSIDTLIQIKTIIK